MGNYSIKDLEQLSGIKAHTLRVWEQRYSVLNPERTETNIRTYSDEDLKSLLNITFLNKNGYKISHIAKMTVEEVNELVLSITESNIEFSNQVDSLIIAMVELDEGGFEKIISTNILRFGFEKTMLKIIYPFLNKIGILWQTGSISPSHEHFISNLIRQKIIVATDGQTLPRNDNVKKYILFLPEGELHEIGLLFSNYIIKSRNNKVIYLGESVPMLDLKEVHDYYKPNYLYTVLTTSPAHLATQDYLAMLAKTFPKTKILVTGNKVMNCDFDVADNILIFNHMDELLNFIEKNSQSSHLDNSNIRQLS